MQEFIFWWSVVSTILSVILLGVSIWQIVEGRKQKERSNAQVKIWMQNANGISLGLRRIIQDNIDKRYSKVNDVCNAIWALEASAFSLYQSLYEERAVTEKEFKEKQKRLEEEARDLRNQQNAQSTGGSESRPTGEEVGKAKRPTTATRKKTKTH